MTLLSVNLNRVALLRNARRSKIPSVTEAAQICVDAGAGGITVHPRPDGRHIVPQDVRDLADMLAVEFNVEGNPFPEFLELVKEVRPTQSTLVPDAPAQKSSDHGWDLSKDGDRLRPIIRTLKEYGIRVSLFMEPDIDQIRRAKDIGADRIELYTQAYAEGYERGDWRDVWDKYAAAARVAQRIGLGVNAGHDLSLKNVRQFCKIPGILECSIGHALIAEALEMGLANTVKAYLSILQNSDTHQERSPCPAWPESRPLSSASCW